MDNHAVPRQITTFEFKLLGFFTLRQGAYLIVFTGLAVVVYFLIPVPLLNLFSAFIVGLIGALLVFFRYNDRPTDVWIKNIFASLMRPSQFKFHKDNDAPDFLKGIRIADDTKAQTHLDASKKLHGYLSQTGQSQQADLTTQKVTTLIQTTPAPPATQVTASAPTVVTPATASTTTTIPLTPSSSSQGSELSPTITKPTPSEPVAPQQKSTPETKTSRTPFLSGVVKNSKDVLLPNIMVYVNSEAGELVRILKTNHNGVFATFHQLPAGNYALAPKDLGGTYFFDTINVPINGAVPEPIQIVSKELL